MTNYWRSVCALQRDVLLFLITPALIGLTVFGGIYSVLFNLYLVRLDYGAEFVGRVNAISQFGLAVFALPASAVGLQLGTRRTMIIGLVLAVAGYALPALAEFVSPVWRQGWILGTYLGGGLGLALYMVNSSPWVMAMTTPAERGQVFSIQAALWPLAGFVGSLVGGVLPILFSGWLQLPMTAPAPFRYPLLIAAGLLGIGVAVLWLTAEPPRPAPVADVAGAPVRVAPVGIIAMIMAVGVLRGSGEGAARTFFNVYMDTALGVSAVQIGLFLALGQLASAPAALLSPLFAARWGHGRSIIGGTVGSALVLLPMALASNWMLVGSAFMAMFVVIAIARPAYMVYTQEIVAQPWRGAMAAATTMSIGISWALMSFGGGYVISLVGYRPLFLAGALSSAVGALLFWAYFRTPRGEFARQLDVAA